MSSSKLAADPEKLARLSSSDLVHSESGQPKSTSRMALLRRCLLLFLATSLLVLAVTSSVTRIQSHRVSAPCIKDVAAFREALNSIDPGALHEVLHGHLKDRYQDGVYEEDREALVAVHRQDAELAKNLMRLAKRQATGDNATTSDEVSPSTTSDEDSPSTTSDEDSPSTPPTSPPSTPPATEPTSPPSTPPSTPSQPPSTNPPRTTSEEPSTAPSSSSSDEATPSTAPSRSTASQATASRSETSSSEERTSSPSRNPSTISASAEDSSTPPESTRGTTAPPRSSSETETSSNESTTSEESTTASSEPPSSTRTSDRPSSTRSRGKPVTTSIVFTTTDATGGVAVVTSTTVIPAAEQTSESDGENGDTSLQPNTAGRLLGAEWVLAMGIVGAVIVL